MQSDGALDLKVNCARQLTANLVFSELYYLQNFFFVQQDSLANERLKKRERRYQLNGKYQDLYAHVQVLRKYLNEDLQDLRRSARVRAVPSPGPEEGELERPRSFVVGHYQDSLCGPDPATPAPSRRAS